MSSSSKVCKLQTRFSVSTWGCSHVISWKSFSHKRFPLLHMRRVIQFCFFDITFSCGYLDLFTFFSHTPSICFSHLKRKRHTFCEQKKKLWVSTTRLSIFFSSFKLQTDIWSGTIVQFQKHEQVWINKTPTSKNVSGFIGEWILFVQNFSTEHKTTTLGKAATCMSRLPPFGQALVGVHKVHDAKRKQTNVQQNTWWNFSFVFSGVVRRLFFSWTVV